MQVTGTIIDNGDGHRCAPGSGNKPITPDASAAPEAGGAAGTGGVRRRHCFGRRAVPSGWLPDPGVEKAPLRSFEIVATDDPDIPPAPASQRKAPQRTGFKPNQKRDQDADQRDDQARAAGMRMAVSIAAMTATYIASTSHSRYRNIHNGVSRNAHQ